MINIFNNFRRGLLGVTTSTLMLSLSSFAQEGDADSIEMMTDANTLGATAAEATNAAATAGADAMAALNSGDIAWMIVACALVLLMTPGLGFFYAGMVRTKNAVATVMQSIIALSIISVLWYVIGYSIAFAPGSSILGGFQWAMFNGVGGAPNADYAGTIPHGLFAIFQCMFAIITPALIAGAFAERMRFKSYCFFIALWSLVV